MVIDLPLSVLVNPSDSKIPCSSSVLAYRLDDTVMEGGGRVVEDGEKRAREGV